jgi:hypothetical protein
MLKAKLVVVGGDAKSKEVNLRLPTVIGRGRDVSLTLPHPLVSRRHTELFEKEGYLYVRDLGSLNGTYVNNRKISGQQRLAPNELLTLGNVTFRAMYDAGGVPDSDIVRSAEISDAAPPTERPLAEKAQEKDETVQFESTDDDHGHVGNAAGSRKPLQDVAAQQTPVSAKPASVSSESPVSDGTSDKVETPSDIFSGDEDFLSPEKSISLNALESLPPVNPAVSMMGSALDFGNQLQRPAVDAIDLDVEGQRPDGPGKSDAALGSFLKQLPR